jgi:hypothetical protein
LITSSTTLFVIVTKYWKRRKWSISCDTMRLDLITWNQYMSSLFIARCDEVFHSHSVSLKICQKSFSDPLFLYVFRWSESIYRKLKVIYIKKLFSSLTESIYYMKWIYVYISCQPADSRKRFTVIDNQKKLKTFK